ncbi:hypothetical protein [Maribacter sp. 2-571]|uniref:hypothetical protein n=1 Tax=Maribacter sp. 2-571 TaxID=3417569 RepID=UPI003D3389B5
MTPKKYLSHLYYKKTSVGSQLFRKDVSSEYLIGPKPSSSLDQTIRLLLFLIPIFYFSYEVLPKNLKEYQFLFWTIHDHGFKNVYVFVWYTSQLLCFLGVLLIWFLTETRWWRYAILSPFVLVVYRLWEVFFNTSSSVVDESEYLRAAPFVLFILLILILLSRLVRVKYQILDIHDWLENEMEELLNSTQKR